MAAACRAAGLWPFAAGNRLQIAPPLVISEEDLLRGLDRLPRRGGKPEWQHSQDYLYEREVLPSVDFSDPRFSYRA